MKARAYALAALLLASCSEPASSSTTQETYVPMSGQDGKDVVWVPTPEALVNRMLDMAKLTSRDYLVDLGSGDGRTVITAAKRGVRAHGIEYNPDLVALSQRNARAASVERLATFERADIFESDFSKASVVTLFLLPSLNLKLRPTLLDMKPGTRIVSNTFDMGDWQPDEKIDAGGDCTSWCRAFKWTVPAKVAGEWRFEDGTLQLAQTFQNLRGVLVLGRDTLPLSEAKMDGPAIAFTAGGRRYSGNVTGGTMTLRGPDGRPRTASLQASRTAN